MLDLPRNREFNKTEHAGVTRQTAGNYTDLLLDVELIDQRRPRVGIGLQISFGSSSS
ncbi:hypothetical protein AArcSt11_07350 [Natranaeroarchaeum aerophilus]|uniref:Uncharacterized protein n=1 Tax=Natranaeroarchaeum aerophilus TaxID=2917711 RepID=A0AAE3FQY5_9EURY|nr:hypothetical protein [Natranaeroarchaeum aerophilus]MCL9813470.1 hypothetical protein [Natranaeroarchaeum aerophilus]